MIPRLANANEKTFNVETTGGLKTFFLITTYRIKYSFPLYYTNHLLNLKSRKL